MTNQHPITPPPELVEQWMHPASGSPLGFDIRVFATQATRWGADQELEACCEWTSQRTVQFGDGTWPADVLRDARRPKPPSLKEQALEALGPEPLPENSPAGDAYLNRGAIERHRTIRRALEALPE
jgi:hypothetical protein